MARKMKTMDGNTAAAHVSYAYTDVAAIYPITPSSNMAEEVDLWSAQGRKNIFGRTVTVSEMQSEAGAAGAVHGSLAAGAFTTTYTASQGLLLMIPNMYKMAGEMLPGVIHVSARAIATHALSIFGDHSDIYACRQTGYAMLASSSVQEVMDLSPVSHLASLTGKVPFVSFFDGFRTSHEVDKIEVWDYEDLADMMDWEAMDAYRKTCLNPNTPTQRGTAQNPDIYFQNAEVRNKYYDALPEIVEEYMGKINAKIGTNYKPFNYYGPEDAEHVIIAMGSVCQTIEETIDYLNASGSKFGLVNVHLYRPFCKDRLMDAIPASAKTVSVLDRTKEPGSIGEPLYLDVSLAVEKSGRKLDVLAGRYGLASKDTTPADIIAVYKNAQSKAKPRFTLSITDDVTHLSLPREENPDTSPEGTTSCKFWGLGADGTVGANKNSIKIIGDQTDMYAQAYFSYDSKKSGGITVSHLRFGKSPIKSTYLVNSANFVACHNPAYINQYDMVSEVKPGGTFLLNCSWTDKELNEHLPGSVKKYIAENNINFYVIDGISIGRDIGLGGRINTVLQSAFFKLANIIPIDDALKFMKDAATASYGSKGDEIVAMNHKAIDAGAEQVRKIEVPADWASATGGIEHKKAVSNNPKLAKFIDEILTPINAQHGDDLPVSAFLDSEDGSVPMGSSAFEKRGIAVDVPEWQPENCIQCTFCSYVCPHAVNRPVIMTEEETKNAPAGTKFVDATGLPGYKFAMVFSVLDCTGCGSCANVCPGRKGEKALLMKPLEEQLHEQPVFDYATALPAKVEVAEKFKPTTVKGSQFIQPLLEFSGACAGCGETPYAKLVTQLFGRRMYIAQATGCSSIWGGSAPANPYTADYSSGRGPTWANSLFEDNAEFGYGMHLAQKSIRDSQKIKLEELAKTEANLKAVVDEYTATYDNGAENELACTKLIAELEKSSNPVAKEVLADKDYLNKKSIWIFGGDGWAYDIGFGGLDHVIASGEDVNILVFDTEVYSNTGGQASKATPIGAVAQFAAAGMSNQKKDLAGIAMTYNHVYVASVGMGADYNQTLKAFNEAESYNGPSIIIAYSPCINHGMKGGMTISQTQIKRAVEAGYWHLFRFDPRLRAEGKNPFILDSKEPTMSYLDFIKSEVRYSSLTRSFPQRAEELFPEATEVAKERYNHLLRLSKLYAVE